jgi:hypothetical protein
LPFDGRFPYIYIPYINGNNFSFLAFHEPDKCAVFSCYNLTFSGYNEPYKGAQKAHIYKHFEHGLGSIRAIMAEIEEFKNLNKTSVKTRGPWWPSGLIRPIRA